MEAFLAAIQLILLASNSALTVQSVMQDRAFSAALSGIASGALLINLMHLVAA